MLIILALAASLLRYLIFPVADYPDAAYIYPKSFLNAFLTDKDYILDVDLVVFPDNQFLSLIIGSIYSYFPGQPSLSYWLVSSSPFFLFSLICEFYLKFLSAKESKALFRKILNLLIVCPSTSYYLCTLHVEALANVLGLGYVLTLISFILSYISASVHDKPRAVLPSLPTLVILIVVNIIGFSLFGDYQFLLCAISLLVLFLCFRNLSQPLFAYPAQIAYFLKTLLGSSTLSIGNLLKLVLFSAPLAVISLFPYFFRNAVLSYSLDSRLSSALSLYDEESLYANKYPLLLRPLMTINNIFVFTPWGFTASLLGKILGFVLISTAWFRALTSKNYYTSRLASVTAFCLILPLPIIFLLPGYVNLKYYLFLLPILFVWPAVYKYKSFLLVLVFIWLELLVRSLIVRM